MAEDIDKLTPAGAHDGCGTVVVNTASLEAENARLRSRVSELEAERDRALRNRDMWKGQSERQAATIRGLRISVHTAIVELAALVPNPRCVGNSDWPEFLNAADRQCLTDAYDALDATRSNGAAAPTPPVTDARNLQNTQETPALSERSAVDNATTVLNRFKADIRRAVNDLVHDTEAAGIAGGSALAGKLMRRSAR